MRPPAAGLATVLIWRTAVQFVVMRSSYTMQRMTEVENVHIVEVTVNAYIYSTDVHSIASAHGTRFSSVQIVLQ